MFGINISEDKFEEIEDKLKKLDYHYGIDNYYEEVVIGLSPNNIQDNETMLEFRQRVKNLVKDELDIEQELCWHIDGGRDS